MPLNKDAFIRYRVINNLLVNKKFITKQEIINACFDELDVDISSRTVELDIKNMREDSRLGFFAPIVYNKNKKKYHYDDINYSIDKIPLNKEDIETLSLAANIFNQYKDIGIFNRSKGAIQKLIDTIKTARFEEKAIIPDFIEFEKAPVSSGNNYLDFIIKAINDKKIIEILHKKFSNDKPIKRNIHPFHLKEYRNRWYVIGYCENARNIRIFALDRILSLEILADSSNYYKNFNYDPEIFFKNIIGITSMGNKPVYIKLKFNELQGEYILSQPIHESQKVIINNKNEVIVSLKVVVNYEFIVTILGWGSDLKVISPPSLVELMKNETSKMHDLYC